MKIAKKIAAIVLIIWNACVRFWFIFIIGYIVMIIGLLTIYSVSDRLYVPHEQIGLDDCYEKMEKVCDEYGYQTEKIYEETLTEKTSWHISILNQQDIRIQIYLQEFDEPKYSYERKAFELYYTKKESRSNAVEYDLNFVSDLLNSIAEYSLSEDDIQHYINKLRKIIYNTNSEYQSDQMKMGFSDHSNTVVLSYVENDEEKYTETLSISGEIKNVTEKTEAK